VRNAHDHSVDIVIATQGHSEDLVLVYLANYFMVTELRKYRIPFGLTPLSQEMKPFQKKPGAIYRR
jgi:hypothetical protein